MEHMMEHTGVLPWQCPACVAHSRNQKFPWIVYPAASVHHANGILSDALKADDPGTVREKLHQEADNVIKGILGGSDTGLSRGKVDEIGRAVGERQAREQRDDGFRRAIR